MLCVDSTFVLGLVRRLKKMSLNVNGVSAVSNDHTPSNSTAATKQFRSSTLALHADDDLNRTTDVSPALHVSTTFRYASSPGDLKPASELVVSLVLLCMEDVSILSPEFVSDEALRLNIKPRILFPLTPTSTPVILPQIPPAWKPSLPPSCTPLV